MAKTAGYVVPSEFGYYGEDYTPDATPFYYLNFNAFLLVPYMVKRWMDYEHRYLNNMFRRHQFKLDWFISDVTERSVEILFKGDSTIKTMATSASGNGWGVGVMPFTFPNKAWPSVRSVDGYGSEWMRPPAYTMMELQSIREGGTEPVYYMIYAEIDGYTAITDVGNTVDNTERTTEADKPYTTYRPLSSWQVSNFLSLVDRLMYEARYIVNIPCINSTT